IGSIPSYPTREVFGAISKLNNSRPPGLDALHAEILKCGNLGHEEAIKIEHELLTEYAFNIPQLLELAGYSCAVAITQVYPLDKMSKDGRAILVCCGPDSNGGHGLVCARHLKHFGYKPSIFYPKTSTQQVFENLRLQCERMDMPFLSFFPSEPHLIDSAYNLVVDAIYGSCHMEPVKGDFANVLETLKKIENPLVSLDIPSGWDIENGDPEGLQPAMLISLTCPKRCARHFQGPYHYLGGRYLPRTLELRYELNLPPYSGIDCTVELRTQHQTPVHTTTTAPITAATTSTTAATSSYATATTTSTITTTTTTTSINNPNSTASSTL
ncbi:NAD(P)H-hydrate epimerase-like, partial [Argonauta hians]